MHFLSGCLEALSGVTILLGTLLVSGRGVVNGNCGFVGDTSLLCSNDGGFVDLLGLLLRVVVVLGSQDGW